MSQTDKKRRKLAMAIGESFVAIRRRTARSQAWLSLSAPAMKIYIELKLRWRHKDNNNGHLYLSIAECKNLLDIPLGTAHRAFRELEQKGFIVMTRKGEAGKLNSAVLDNGGFGYSRRASTWAITDEPYRGQAATHAYEKWTPEAQKQIRGSTSGTRMVPPVERKPADSSSSGTYSSVLRPLMVLPVEYLYLPSIGSVLVPCPIRNPKRARIQKSPILRFGLMVFSSARIDDRGVSLGSRRSRAALCLTSAPGCATSASASGSVSTTSAS